jgi:2-deoxy-D-gluconate 3-dehydrogenase
MFELNGKVAIVTGGNSGIGLGMARALARAGACVAIFGRNPEKNAAALQEIDAFDVQTSVHAVDVTDAAAVEAAIAAVVAQHGRLDILVNNAGTTIRKRVSDLTEDDWNLVMSTNVTSAFLCSKAAYAYLKRDGGGKVLNCGSMYSLFGAARVPVYAASKGAVVQLTKSLAVDWAADNIQVNCFLPGWINTDLTAQARIELSELDDKVKTRTPAGRWGEPSDMEGIAVFLSSPASDFITGTAIPVDGGYSING